MHYGRSRRLSATAPSITIDGLGSRLSSAHRCPVIRSRANIGRNPLGGGRLAFGIGGSSGSRGSLGTWPTLLFPDGAAARACVRVSGTVSARRDCGGEERGEELGRKAERGLVSLRHNGTTTATL